MINKHSQNWFVHPNGICESKTIGQGTRIWAFAHVLPGATVGSNVNLCDFTFVENDVVLGDRVTVKTHVALWDGLRVEDDVFIGPGVKFANDKYPRSKRHLAQYPTTVLRKGVSIGAGAVILPGVDIGAYALVAAGAVVTKNVLPFHMVRGLPAKYAGLVCKCGGVLQVDGQGLRCSLGNWQGSAPFLSMECSNAC